MAATPTSICQETLLITTPSVTDMSRRMLVVHLQVVKGKKVFSGRRRTSDVPIRFTKARKRRLARNSKKLCDYKNTNSSRKSHPKVFYQTKQYLQDRSSLNYDEPPEETNNYIEQRYPFAVVIQKKGSQMEDDDDAVPRGA